MKRPKGTMSFELYQRIIDQAATSPHVEKVTLTGLGEPLLDRFLARRVRYARQQMAPGVLIDMYTNGNLLRPKVTDELIDAGLDVLYVSLNATSAIQRRETMKLDDYEQTVAYTKYAVEAYNKKAARLKLPATRNRFRVIVKGVATKDLFEIGDSDVFEDQWNGDHQKGGNSYLHLEGNWAGATGQKMRRVPRHACGRALGQIMVLWTGEVSLCCFDSEGAVILGDLNHQTLRDIYAGQPALGIREAHVNGKRGELPLCSTCTAI
jgi:hypothetical protein